MLNEYAVDPQLMGSDFNLFCMLMGYFGIERGRLISQFPKSWARAVIETAKDSGIQDVKLASLVNRLNKAKIDTLIRSGRNYDPELGDWISNATKEHAVSGFHAIISGSNPTNCPSVIDIHDFDSSDHLMTSQTAKEVGRTATGIFEELRTLIQMAKRISLIDPFFEIFSPKYTAPLHCLFSELHSKNSSIRSVQIHRKYSGIPLDIETIGINAPRFLAGTMPDGYSIEVYEWKQKANGHDLHDRFMICDCGGVSVGAGFSAEGHHEKALVSLLPKKIAEDILDRFRPDSFVYDLAQPVLVFTSDCRVQTRNA